MHSSKKIGIILFIVAIVVILAGFTSASDRKEHEPKVPAPSHTTREDLHVRSTTVFTGSGLDGILRDTDLSAYSSKLQDAADITASMSGNVIPVKGRRKIELIVSYDPLDLKSTGLFGGGSAFYVVQEDGSQARPTDAGGQQSFTIENNKAGVTFSPFVYITDEYKGGKATLVLSLETKQGNRLEKEWILAVSPYVVEK